MHWPEVRDLLNRHCGYEMADDEILLLEIGGGLYFIADILLRMLTPRELYNAMGFPPDYIIDRDYLGNEYGKTKQVARCGNAVCPPMATALVRANLPEWCNRTITTMEELEKAVLKMRRALVGATPLTQSEARALINEEVADVLNCVEALEAISFVDRGQVARIQAEKLERWDRRTREGVT